MAATPGWLATIEALLSRGIESSAQAQAVAARLDATALRVQVDGMATVHASVNQGRLALTTSDGPADATISGAPLALLSLARGTQRSGASRAAQVQGDAEIANSYKQLFALARPDIEEEFAHVVGDLPARRLAQLAQQTLAWARQVRRIAGDNVAEYLQEESRDLVSKPELEEFLHGVDAMREIADRVEARLGRLERRRKDGT